MNSGTFLGSHIKKLLDSSPFDKWDVQRTTEDDLEEQRIFYVFPERGLQIRCCVQEKIRVIFLDASHKELEGIFVNLPFLLERSKVQEKLGRPSKTGEKRTHPILGDFGAWDRFSSKDHSTHVEYWPDSDKIKMITLMENAFTPK